MVDGRGRPLKFILTGGQAHDAPTLPDLLGHGTPPLAVCADKAYDSRAIRQAICDDGAIPVIPCRATNKKQIPYDTRLYRERNIVERFFCRLKDMRRIAQRFDKHADNFLSAVYLFSIRLWVNY